MVGYHVHRKDSPQNTANHHTVDAKERRFAAAPLQTKYFAPVEHTQALPVAEHWKLMASIRFVHPLDHVHGNVVVCQRCKQMYMTGHDLQYFTWCPKHTAQQHIRIAMALGIVGRPSSSVPNVPISLHLLHWDGLTNGRMNGRTIGRSDGQTYERTYGRSDERTDGRADGRPA